MISTVTVTAALISLVVALIAVGWLSVISRHLSALGKRVLESEDIGRVIQAADKTGSFDSRIAGCEGKTTDSQNKLAEHETRLNELTDKLAASGQMISTQAADVANASERIASFEARFAGFENSVGDKLNNLPELGTRVSDLAAKLESIEQMVNKNGTDLAEADRNIKSLTDEVQNLEEFRTAIEKTRNLILGAFTDMPTSTLHEEAQTMTPQAAEPDETSEDAEAANPEVGY
jgi:chromosome segregation ATPase